MIYREHAQQRLSDAAHDLAAYVADLGGHLAMYDLAFAHASKTLGRSEAAVRAAADEFVEFGVCERRGLALVLVWGTRTEGM